MHTSEVLVIGAGLAGERVAIELATRGHDVTILSLVPPRRSHSSAAQGGMQAALGNMAMSAEDSVDVHFEDTVKGSDWGANQDVVRLFAKSAPIAVREAAYWGVPWSRVVAGPRTLAGGDVVVESGDKEGLIAQRDFGGTKQWRACYAADGTGHALMFAIDNEVVRLGITVHERMEAISLIHDGESCHGAIVRDIETGELHEYTAHATVIATGGHGRIYGQSTNAVINTGSGMAIALETGVVPLGNMEAVQFHPTGVVPGDILVSEACRGDGGYLLDVNEHRFMPEYEPDKKELASRDVVSRRMTLHMRKGLGVETSYGSHLWLDIRHLGREHIERNLQEVADITKNFLGIDPADGLVPVRPTQHYSMGGIRTSVDGAAYGLNGLYAAGEVGCWDMHGFNRLGGNSVAETLVMGRVVGRAIADRLEQGDDVINPGRVRRQSREALLEMEARIEQITSNGNNGSAVHQIEREIGRILRDGVGVFRDKSGLQSASAELTELQTPVDEIGLKTSAHKSSPEVASTLRLSGRLKLARTIAEGALARKESRGSHYREDFPNRDDENWLNRTLAYWPDGASTPKLEYESVTITEIPPGDRGYGEGASKPPTSHSRLRSEDE